MKTHDNPKNSLLPEIHSSTVLTLCLVNTYDKLKLHEIHLRSIARAAPLCYAYGFHLALLDFDFWENEEDMVSAIMNYTTIGKHGEYAEKLLQKGWVHLIDTLHPQFGEIVATTSKPENRKKIGREELKEILSGSAIFLIGLGRKGLPKKLLNKAKFHLDVTFNGISLETCTAMGAIAVLIHLTKVPEKG